MPDPNALWESSAQAWTEFVDQGDANREALLDPIVLKLCGEVRGRQVIDLGCGEGRFTRQLVAAGAQVVGLDPARALLARARARGRGMYLRASAEQLPFQSNSFDLAVSYLTIIDIPDFRQAIGEMARVLRGGGQLIVASINSFATTRDKAWEYDSMGNPLFVPVDRYFEERAERVGWAGIDIMNYHRPLESYMEAYLGAGLILRGFQEPKPTLEALASFPKLREAARVPFFNVMLWEKPRL